MIFHFIIARKHGEAHAYCVAAAFDDAGLLALIDKYSELEKSTSGFAEENSDLLFATVDGEILKVRHTHSFADPGSLEAGRNRAALERALAKRHAIERAERDAVNAQTRLAEAKAVIETFSDEEKALLAEHDRRAEKSRKAHEKHERALAQARDAEEARRRESHRITKEKASASADSATQAVQAATVTVGGGVSSPVAEGEETTGPKLSTPAQ